MWMSIGSIMTSSLQLCVSILMVLSTRAKLPRGRWRNRESGGSIIGMSSINALVGGGLQTHYTPTKAGVLSLMQSMAVALGKYKIRCNALLPGTIKTQLNEEDLANEEKRKYMEIENTVGEDGGSE